MIINPYVFGQSVKIDLPFNGVNGGTVFTDLTGRSWTGNGNAQTSTAQFFEGTASLLLDGTGDFISTPHDVNLNAAGSFTVTCYVRPATVASIRTIASKRQTVGLATGWAFVIDATAKLGIFAWDGAGNLIVNVVGTTSIVANVWTKVSFTKVNTQWSVYINDVQDATGAQTGTPGNTTLDMLIGRDPSMTARDFNGYIDVFRLLRS